MGTYFKNLGAVLHSWRREKERQATETKEETHRRLLKQCEEGAAQTSNRLLRGNYAHIAANCREWLREHGYDC